MNINETTTESVGETEPAENAENTEKIESTIMVSEISIFTLAVENLQFNCDQCNKTNSSEKGLTRAPRGPPDLNLPSACLQTVLL